MNIYAVKDEVIGFTGAIMTAHNDEVVIRNMRVMANEEGNQMNMWAKDFSAWHVGKLDRVDGNIEPCQPRLVCRANSLQEVKQDGVPNSV